MSAAGEPKSLMHLIKYTLSHAPWALIMSLSIGFSRYVIVIMVIKFYGLALGGQFRLLLSTINILGLFTLIDSRNVLIKHLVQNATGVVRTIYLQRLRWSFLAMLIGFGVAGWYYAKGDDVWIPLLIASACLPLSNPSSLYIQINQANKNFRLNAFYALAKWGVIVLSIYVLAVLQVNIVWIMCIYFVLGALFNILYLSRHHEVREPENDDAPLYRRESLQLSGSGAFTVLLDNADKFLVPYFFGLEVLGLYVIGVSTGRLFLHFVKPTLSIFYPLLVKHRFTPALLIAGFAILSVIGAVSAYLMQYYFEYILGSEYMDAYPLAAIILVGLGIYFVGVIYYFSALYHKDGSAKIPAISNIITAVAIMIYMVAALTFGGDYALLLCAASYPLRELVRLIVIRNLNSRADKTVDASTVQ